MTPPFQPGDRVTVRYSKPLGVLTVEKCEPMYDGSDEWFCTCTAITLAFTGPATSLIKVEDEARREA